VEIDPGVTVLVQDAPAALAELAQDRLAVGQRAFPRSRCRAAHPVRLTAPGLPSVPRLASLRDLSPTGVGLLVDRLVEPGVVFVVEVLTWGGTPLRLVARVVQASPCSEDRWLLGCALYRHLAPRELEDLA
jgi:hypothetical protein